MWVKLLVICFLMANKAGSLQVRVDSMLASGKQREAAQLLRRMVAIHPWNPEANFLLGKVLFRTGRLEVAMVPLRTASANPRFAPQATRILGIDLYELGRFREAIAELEKASQFYPDSPETLYYLISACRRAGQTAQGTKALERLLRVGPSSAYTYKLMGEAYDNEEDWERATQALQLAIAKAPHLPELHFELGMVYWQRLDYKQAVSEFWSEINGVKWGPSVTRAWFYLGDIAMKRFQYQVAVDYFSHSLRLDARQYDTLCRLAAAYESLGRRKNALQNLRRAESLRPQRATAHWELGQILKKMGQTREAARELQLFEAAAHRHPEAEVSKAIQ